MCRRACQHPKLLDQVRFLDGLLKKYLASVTDSTVVFEAARRGSTPWQGTDNMSSECAGFARDFAMVEDQVRFLAGTFVFSWSLPKEVSREQTQ